MSGHLTAEEFVDGLDRPLASSRQAHLATCEACADQWREMRAILTTLEGTGEVPEPSPLFWDHLSDRVRTAVAAVPMSAPWWRTWRGWMPLVAATAAVALVLLTGRPAPVAPIAQTAEESGTVSGSDAVWDMISTLAPQIGAEQAEEFGLVPGEGMTDAAIASLTPAQRRELMRLLKAEIGAE